MNQEENPDSVYSGTYKCKACMFQYSVTGQANEDCPRCSFPAKEVLVSYPTKEYVEGCLKLQQETEDAEYTRLGTIWENMKESEREHSRALLARVNYSLSQPGLGTIFIMIPVTSV